MHALDYGGFMPSSNDNISDSEGFVRIVADVMIGTCAWSIRLCMRKGAAGLPGHK